MSRIGLTTISVVAGVASSIILLLDVSSWIKFHQALASHGGSPFDPWRIDLAFDLASDFGLVLFFLAFTARNRIGTATMKTAIAIALACTLLQIARLTYNLARYLLSSSEQIGTDPLYSSMYLLWFSSIALFFWTLHRRLTGGDPARASS